MSGRREVRVVESFFEELDAQLGSERGPNGEPSATDFIVIDLPRIVDEFARLGQLDLWLGVGPTLSFRTAH